MDKIDVTGKSADQIKWMLDRLIDDLETALQGEAKEAAKEEVDTAGDQGRDAMLDEILTELESAIGAAEAEDAPAVGTEETWGKDDLKGMRSFLAYLEANYR